VESEDRWAWKDSETTTFSVKSAYRSLRRDGGRKFQDCTIFSGGLRRFLRPMLQLGG